jgi:zinc D-Ala-D-Ala carboxypeptidase
MNYGKFFSESEFKCSHCGVAKMDQDFINRLNELRREVGVPLRVTSGYRCPDHPIEARKVASGAHTTGKAVDFAVEGRLAHELLKQAMEMNFKGIGVQQKGTGRFIHLDDWVAPNRPTVWSY